MSNRIPLALNIIALCALLNVLELEHIASWAEVVTATLSIALGFVIGKLTCHIHKKSNTIWPIILLFITLNLLHSMIDGISVGSAITFANITPVIAHELGRQPALYILLWGLFSLVITKNNQYTKLILTFLSVTGVWTIGSVLGHDLISEQHWAITIAELGMFVFLGDIIHHIIEEYYKLSKPKQCCHH